MSSPFAAVVALDRRLSAASRLAIVMALAAVEEIDFSGLVRLTGLNKGKVSHYIADLRAAGLVDVTRTIEAERLRATLRLTPAG